MKIYFDGCSWTEGAELENPEEERFSRLLCQEFDAEEKNISCSGASNDRLVRNLLVNKKIEEYDLAVIQMTFPARTEYYSGTTHKKGILQSGWICVNPKYNFSYFLHKRKYRKIKNVDAGPADKQSEIWKDIEDYFHFHKDFWKQYYMTVTTEKFFNTKENIHQQTIRNHCQVKGVPLILSTINAWTPLKFDLHLNTNHPNVFKNKEKLPTHRMGHPTKEGHRMIANQIIEIAQGLL